MSEKFDMAQMKARFQAAHEEFSDLVGKLNSGELEEGKLPRIYELERELAVKFWTQRKRRYLS